MQLRQRLSKEQPGADFDKMFENVGDPSVSGHLTVDLILDDEEIIGFSALHGNGVRFPPGYARVLTRLWFKEWDEEILDQMVKVQMHKAIETNLEAVFVSSQDRSRLEKMVQTYPNWGFQMLPDMYNTCNSTGMYKACWQNVAACWLGNSRRLPLARMKQTDWFDRFG